VTYLRRLLEDVLAGRVVVNDAYTFRLLRTAFPDKDKQLGDLEGQAIGRRTQAVMTPVERIYREMKGTAPPAQQASTSAPDARPEPNLNLTKKDAEEIVAERRPASLEEIEWLLRHAQDYRLRLSNDNVYSLRRIASRLSAQARSGGQGVDPSVEFLVTVLGHLPTEHGTLERSEVEQLRAIRFTAARAIQACTHHMSERCRCWSDARTALYAIRCRAGEASPLGIAALRVWENLEQLAAASRDTAPQPETPYRNWQSWKYWRQVAPTDPNAPPQLSDQ
jgi:hypothetical protein